jgi:hypothetical protein
VLHGIPDLQRQVGRYVWRLAYLTRRLMTEAMAMNRSVTCHSTDHVLVIWYTLVQTSEQPMGNIDRIEIN